MFTSGFNATFTAGGFDLTTEYIQLYYTGYTINGGKYWNNQSIEYKKVIFNFHTDKYFVIEKSTAVKLTDQRIWDYEFSYFKSRHAFLENADKFPVETIPTGYQYTLEFTDIMENIYINIVNENTKFTPSVMGYIVIAGAVGIIAVIGIRIWRKFKK